MRPSPRRRHAAETGLLAGAAALVAVFLVLVAVDGRRRGARAAAADVARVLDARLSCGYLSGVAARRGAADGRHASTALVAAAIVAAVGRGLFVWGREHAGSPVVRIGFPQDNWTDAMQWISRTPADTHVLADPGHAWKYGTSVRVAGERDVYLEEVKDLALALYSRDVAVEALRADSE